MAREARVPGGLYINETGTRQARVAGDGYINETVSGVTPSFKSAWAKNCNVLIKSGDA